MASAGGLKRLYDRQVALRKSRCERVRKVRRCIGRNTRHCCCFCIRAVAFGNTSELNARTGSMSETSYPDRTGHGPDAIRDQEKSTYVETPHGGVAVLRRDRRAFQRPCAKYDAAAGQMGTAGFAGRSADRDRKS